MNEPLARELVDRVEHEGHIIEIQRLDAALADSKNSSPIMSASANTMSVVFRLSLTRAATMAVLPRRIVRQPCAIADAEH